MLNSLNIYIDLIEKIFELIERKKRKNKVLTSPIGDTLHKVEKAQEHLTDAVEAIGIIKNQAIKEKDQLDNLLAEVQQKRQQYEDVKEDLNLTKDLLNKNKDKLKAALGINSTRDRLMGFISGVIASVLATAIWVFGSKIWFYLTKAMETKP